MSPLCCSSSSSSTFFLPQLQLSPAFSADARFHESKALLSSPPYDTLPLSMPLAVPPMATPLASISKAIPSHLLYSFSSGIILARTASPSFTTGGPISLVVPFILSLSSAYSSFAFVLIANIASLPSTLPFSQILATVFLSFPPPSTF
eukprot:TRINITY_DN1950_c0_g2_i2.p2 TRINITY_DN1950_c0_g2~~TRINITY_DN1950_c0_g2_i2.p2  ORF type:complete len:148 (+),score=19.85 TRINITY_DN1950_c0_g2_i2:454-897(+)